MTYPQDPTNVELVFEKPASVTDPLAVVLTFGESSGPPVDAEYEAVFNARFSMRGSMLVDYDNAVWRGVVSSLTAPHQNGAELKQLVDAPWQPSLSAVIDEAARYDDAMALMRLEGIVWTTPEALSERWRASWQRRALDASPSHSVPWQIPAPAHLDSAVPWQGAKPVGESMSARFGLAKPEHISPVIPWQTAKEVAAYVQAPMNQAGRPVEISIITPWQQALTLSSYGGRRFLPPPAPVEPGRLPTIQDLRFCGLYPEGGNRYNNVTLVFGFDPCGGLTPGAPLYILPSRVYMTVHQVSAYLYPSGTPVPIFDLTLAADMDSTVWTFSASTPAEYFEALMPISRVPQRLRLVVNGLEWVLLVENLQEKTVFGQRRASIGGRSVTALLGDPYANVKDRLSTVANTAQQHALDALQFTGVDLDWTITDWLVATGAWSHTGTALEAVQAIAAGVGGFINSARSLPKLIVRHPYPTLPGGIPGGPWNWEGAAGAFDADVELAPDSIRERSVDRVDGPDIDGVYVSGTITGGIERHVKRSGTLGAMLAPMSANPLITANAAASQLGYSILGLGGPKHKVSLTLPVLTGVDQPGVLEVGQLVQVNDMIPWRGRVRGVQVSFKPPKLVQVVTLERHLML